MCLFAYSGMLSIMSLLSMTDPTNVGVLGSNAESGCLCWGCLLSNTWHDAWCAVASTWSALRVGDCSPSSVCDSSYVCAVGLTAGENCQGNGKTLFTALWQLPLAQPNPFWLGVVQSRYINFLVAVSWTQMLCCCR